MIHATHQRDFSQKKSSLTDVHIAPDVAFAYRLNLRAVSAQQADSRLPVEYTHSSTILIVMGLIVAPRTKSAHNYHEAN